MINRRHWLIATASTAFFSTSIANGAQKVQKSSRPAKPIDRQALVRRHNPKLTTLDPSSPLMLGNGNIGFSADITGLQTYQKLYSPLSPLLTMAQWAWHAFPNPQNHQVEDTQVMIDVRGKARPYGYIKDWGDIAKKPALAYIRENPHRFSLARLSFDLRFKDGRKAAFADLKDTSQELDLWSGMLKSHFVFDGEAVEVATMVHPDRDGIFVTVTSALVGEGRLKLEVSYPGVSAKLNPDPSDFEHPERHMTRELSRQKGQVFLERTLDETKLFAAIMSDDTSAINKTADHSYLISTTPNSTTLRLCAEFSQNPITTPISLNTIAKAVSDHWRDYWSKGGMIDFQGSTDPRAIELERRIILSQYLMKINASGAFPPQEEGLFSNSWNGKFHLEMHPWHSAHFALWGRPELLEKSMGFYLNHLPDAKKRAQKHGLKGAWWPKMVGPDGVDSPSKVSPFIMWQQPHPIYMAELLYRASPSSALLKRYAEMVFATADLLATYVHYDAKTKTYHMGPPIIPAQENWDPLSTTNPAFELSYFRWGLETANRWRTRLKLKPNATWAKVAMNIAPIPTTKASLKDQLYLPTGSDDRFWEKSAACSKLAVDPCPNRDHPSFLMPLGWLPGRDVNKAVMKNTFERVMRDWDLRQTWGWDYPMIAMTATRLGLADQAIDALFYNGRNNQFGLSGMTPRVHLDAHAQAFIPTAVKTDEQTGPDGVGYKRAAETYFPSNGGLLLAVALMAAGWDGAKTSAPGFAAKGWSVKVEGLLPSL